MKIKILRKKEAISLMKDESFISDWKKLANESDEFTLTQEHDFVSTWYEAYHTQFNPILVTTSDENEHLIGLMCLAISLKNGSISHAGEEQAEYRTWICRQEIQNEFLIESLISLKKEFKLCQWNWGWMAPEANLGWLHSDKLKEHDIHADIQTFDSPRYDLSDLTRINKIKKNKADKSRLNRLKRLGDLRIERITDESLAKRIFIDLKKTYNFRNIAVYNNRAFDEDDFKELWHLNHLAYSGNNVHFTVLWQGDDVLGCNFGYCTDTTVVMGVFAYNPVQGANSPGNTFITMLIEYAAEEGFKYLDLTPGGDLYKERFCNSHITLSKAVISFNRMTRYKNLSSSYLKNKIKEKYSYRDIINFKTSIERKFNNAFKAKPKDIMGTKTVLFEYAEPSKAKALDIPGFAIQKYDDLLIYQEQHGLKRHKDIIFSALKNFERRDHLFTLVKENKLKAFAWVSTSKRKHMDNKVNELINISGEQPLVYDSFFSEDTNEVDVAKFLKKITNHYHDKDRIYLAKPGDIKKENLLNIGFSEYHQKNQAA